MIELTAHIRVEERYRVPNRCRFQDEFRSKKGFLVFLHNSERPIVLEPWPLNCLSGVGGNGSDAF